MFRRSATDSQCSAALLRIPNVAESRSDFGLEIVVGVFLKQLRSSNAAGESRSRLGRRDLDVTTRRVASVSVALAEPASPLTTTRLISETLPGQKASSQWSQPRPCGGGQGCGESAPGRVCHVGQPPAVRAPSSRVFLASSLMFFSRGVRTFFSIRSMKSVPFK